MVEVQETTFTDYRAEMYITYIYILALIFMIMWISICFEWYVFYFTYECIFLAFSIFGNISVFFFKKENNILDIFHTIAILRFI
jgi:hypothetical protein